MEVFSQCPLWQLQRQYFKEANIKAWKEGDVPHYITSNPYMAETYAKVLLGFFRDRLAKGLLTEPIYIVELGTGSGRFSYHLVKALNRLIQNSLLQEIRFVYVMTDFVEDTLAFWDKHLRFQEYYEAGILDFALFDAEKDSTLYLRKSHKTLGYNATKEPLVVIANYFFDTIPQELFYFNEGVAHHVLVNLQGYSPASAKTAKEQLKKIKLKYTYQIIPENPYKDEFQSRLFTYYQNELTDSHLLFPHHGLNCIYRLQQLSKQGLLMLTADKGEPGLNEWQNRKPPYVAKHGSFSLTANYHAILEHCKLQSGLPLFPKHPASGITVGALLYLKEPQNYKETLHAYHEYINNFGPDEYFVIKKHVEKSIADLSISELFAYLRLSGYDSRLFSQFLPRLQFLVDNFTDDDRFLTLQLIAQVWDGYYPLGEKQDLAHEIGILLSRINFYKEAIVFFELSEKIYGKKPDVLFAKVVVYDLLGNKDVSAELLKTLTKIFPDFKPTQKLIKKN
jgi:hypothetical protein